MGQGVERDLSEAMRWLLKAKANGDDVSKQIEWVKNARRQQNEAAAGEEEHESLTIGSRVELRGLTSKKHKKLKLNGCSGVVVAIDSETGRFGVKLDDGRGPFQIPPENCTLSIN